VVHLRCAMLMVWLLLHSQLWNSQLLNRASLQLLEHNINNALFAYNTWYVVAIYHMNIISRYHVVVKVNTKNSLLNMDFKQVLRYWTTLSATNINLLHMSFLYRDHNRDTKITKLWRKFRIRTIRPWSN
jgi:hypothetical protein